MLQIFWRCQGEFCWIQRWLQKVSLAATFHDGGKLLNGADTPGNQLSKSMFIHVHKIGASSCLCHPPWNFPYEIRVVGIPYIQHSTQLLTLDAVWLYIIFIYLVLCPSRRCQGGIQRSLHIRKFQPTCSVRSCSQLFLEIPTWLVPSPPIELGASLVLFCFRDLISVGSAVRNFQVRLPPVQFSKLMSSVGGRALLGPTCSTSPNIVPIYIKRPCCCSMPWRKLGYGDVCWCWAWRESQDKERGEGR